MREGVLQSRLEQNECQNYHLNSSKPPDAGEMQRPSAFHVHGAHRGTPFIAPHVYVAFAQTELFRCAAWRHLYTEHGCAHKLRDVDPDEFLSVERHDPNGKIGRGPGVPIHKLNYRVVVGQVLLLHTVDRYGYTLALTAADDNASAAAKIRHRHSALAVADSFNSVLRASMPYLNARTTESPSSSLTSYCASCVPYSPPKN